MFRCENAMSASTNKARIPRFADSGYKRWVYAGLCLRVLERTLYPLVTSEGRKLWHEVLVTWVQTPAQCTCSDCCACAISFNARRVPRTKCWSISCQSGICAKWVAEISRNHAYAHQEKIAFTNCSVRDWPVSAWEFTKAFMCELSHSGCSHKSPQIKRHCNLVTTTSQGKSQASAHESAAPSRNFTSQQAINNNITGVSRENTHLKSHTQSQTLKVGGRTSIVGKNAKERSEKASNKTDVIEKQVPDNRPIAKLGYTEKGSTPQSHKPANSHNESSESNSGGNMKTYYSLTEYSDLYHGSTQEIVTLEHLLSFLVYFTPLHSSVRKAKDQPGGLTAKHVVRIKKLMTLYDLYMGCTVPQLDVETYQQLVTGVNYLLQALETELQRDGCARLDDQVLMENMDIENLKVHQLEVQLLSKHLTRVSLRKDRNGINEVYDWLAEFGGRDLTMMLSALCEEYSVLERLHNLSFDHKKNQTTMTDSPTTSSTGVQTELHGGAKKDTQLSPDRENTPLDIDNKGNGRDHDGRFNHLHGVVDSSRINHSINHKESHQSSGQKDVDKENIYSNEKQNGTIDQSVRPSVMSAALPTISLANTPRLNFRIDDCKDNTIEETQLFENLQFVTNESNLGAMDGRTIKADPKHSSTTPVEWQSTKREAQKTLVDQTGINQHLHIQDTIIMRSEAEDNCQRKTYIEHSASMFINGDGYNMTHNMDGSKQKRTPSIKETQTFYEIKRLQQDSKGIQCNILNHSVSESSTISSVGLSDTEEHSDYDARRQPTNVLACTVECYELVPEATGACVVVQNGNKITVMYSGQPNVVQR